MRLFLNIPSVYYKCRTLTTESTKGKRDTSKTYKLHETWPVRSDQDLPTIKEHLEYYNNGRGYIVAIKAQALCEVNDARNSLLETLVESQNYVRILQKIVPQSEAKSKLNVIESHITTAFNLSRTTSFTSSTTDITFQQVPPPVAASSRGAPPTRKRKLSSEDEESETGTWLGENQCSCGEFFQDKQDLDIHMKAVHLPSNWSCPHPKCPKYGHPYPKRYLLWKHIRTHHLKSFNFHCKEHEFYCEESGYYKNHLDEVHSIRSDLRCPNEKPCNNKLFATKAKLAAHVQICRKKQKPFACTICTKTFRSDRYLKEHIKLHKDGSVDEEKVVPCPWPGCDRTYKVRSSMLIHYKDKHRRSSLPTRVEATSTSTSENQPEPPQPEPDN